MSYKQTVYAAISGALDAKNRCAESIAHREWFGRWTDRLEYMCDTHLPHGSGIDCGVVLDMDKSRPNRLVFTLGFHNMDSNGYYDGWSHYTAVMTPDLQHGFNLRVTMAGKSRKYANIDYIHELLSHALGLSYDQEILYGDN